MNSSVSNGDSCDIAALKYISSIYMEVSCIIVHISKIFY